jgi:peptide deformylase
MPVREILKYPDPRLKRPANKLEELSDEVARLVQDLLDTMYAAPGVGLAAPQVGLPQRVIVIDVSYLEGSRSPIWLVNPEIVIAEGEISWEEGCLSVVDYTSTVKRRAYVKVKGLDLNENEIEVDGEGLLAVALQHEIDHLDGKLFLDRITKLKRDLYTKRLIKGIKTGKRGTSSVSDLRI